MVNKSDTHNKVKQTRVSYRYVVLAACFLLMVIVYGSQYCFGVFFKPMIAEFGWSRAATSVAFSLYMFVSGLLSVLAGRLSDKFGARLVVTIGSILLGAGYMLAARTGNIWQLYLFYGIVVAAGASTMYVPVVSMITRWFPHNAGLMAGIGISGIGFGIGVVPLIASRLIISLEWHKALFIVGVATFILLLLLAQLLRHPKDGQTVTVPDSAMDKNTGLTLREAMLTGRFWLFCAGWLVYGYIYQIGLVHIVPYATDIGLTVTAAAGVLTVIGLVGIAGRIGLGLAGDKYSNRLTVMVSFGMMALVYAGLVCSNSVLMLYIFAVVFGLLNGVGILLAPIIAEYFGFRSLGSIVGAVFFAHSIGSTLSPALAGKIYDMTGGYPLAFLSCAIFGAISAVIIWKFKPPVKAR